MKELFLSYPKNVAMDTTYDVIDLDFPVVLVTIIDLNGKTEIVTVGAVASEEFFIYEWFLTQLKNENP